MNRGERERLVLAPYGYCNISAHKIFLLLYKNTGGGCTLWGPSLKKCHQRERRMPVVGAAVPVVEAIQENVSDRTTTSLRTKAGTGFYSAPGGRGTCLRMPRRGVAPWARRLGLGPLAGFGA